MKQFTLRRVLSFLLVLAMCLPMLPDLSTLARAASYDYPYQANVMETVSVDVYGQSFALVSDATLTVNPDQGKTYEVVQTGTGRYAFTRPDRSLKYTVVVSAPGYFSQTITTSTSRSYMVFLQVDPNYVPPGPEETTPTEPEETTPTEPEETTPTEPEAPEPVYETFDVYYIANGIIPDSYCGAGEAINYGPSGNDAALVQIKVDVEKLKTYTDAVAYRERVNWELDNFWEFFPLPGTTGKVLGMSTGAVTVEVLSFWNAVKECMHPDSIAAFKETGLYYEYVGYILKRQGWDSAVKDLHCDGILYVQPPVYVVELYQNGTYFGGSLTDSDEGSKFLTVQNILDQYSTYLKQNITWDTDSNGNPVQYSGTYNWKNTIYYSGTYLDLTTNKLHTIEVHLTNYPSTQAIEGSQIPYERRNSTYYLAQFDTVIDSGTSVSYTVTYTDGVADDVFANQQHTANGGDPVPTFEGTPTRPGYTFLGWHLGDDQTTLHYNGTIATMKLTSDMVFHAVWIPVPKYTGTVEIILNGTWDAANATLLSGDHFNVPGVTNVAVSADGVTFIPMDHANTGVYTTHLENGTYHVYFSYDNGATYQQASDQPLIIENQDRTRYLFYNSVTYYPNGGTFEGSTGSYVEYFTNGTQADVRTAIPEREGYAFTGWLNSDGVICQPGTILHEQTNHACELIAQWAKATDVYVNVKLHHANHETNHHNYAEDRNNVTFTVDGRTAGSGVDYTELYVKTITWDGTSEFDVDGYSVTTETGSHDSNNDHHDVDLTTYTATKPTFTNVVLEDMEYTLTSAKSGYEVYEITQQLINGDLYVTLELIYMPDDFDFTFYVELDDEAKTLSDDIKPVAVNVKVTTWYTSTQKWGVADIHENTYHKVSLDENGEGSGSVPVAQKNGNANCYYRIQVISFVMPDGTILPALTTTENTNYATDCGHYTARINVQSGGRPSGTSLRGAYYLSRNSAQEGTVTAIVSVHTHTLTLLTNGGQFSDNTTSKVISKILTVPDFTGYIPTRGDGYTFAGWYLADKNGNMTDTQIVPGTEMDEDLTLIAKWIPPVKVNGLISVAAAYEQENLDGTTTIHVIHGADLAKNIHVLLQKLNPSGYYETIDQQTVELDYTKAEYYFQKDESTKLPVGVANYEFGQLPGNQKYRIYILSSNYTSTYQQEPDSVDSTKRLAYNTYAINRNLAEFGTVEPDTATINAHLHFHPPSFDLQFQVDATAIGQGYQPDSAEVLVTYGNGTNSTEPHNWTVISQMIFDEKLVGCDVALEDGIGNGTDSVWRTLYDGTTYYDYGIRLASTTSGGTKTPYAENPYYTVSYQAPASYLPETGKQNQLLIAYLTPKTYNIIYDTNGGRITGSYTDTHTWSYETALSNVVPIRSGYEFLGWYTDAALTQKLEATTIDANVANDVTFYAKWARVVMQVNVNIDHTIAGGGRVTNYNKDLNVQLQHRYAGIENDYQDVLGQTRTYTSDTWYDSNLPDFDSISVPNAFTGLLSNYDYNAAASMDGYYAVDSITANGTTYTTGVTKNTATAEDGIYVFYVANVCLKAYGEPKVIFHTNNPGSTSNDEFRIYYPADRQLPEGSYAMNTDGTISAFYDIPEFTYAGHNDYIFDGWYTAPDETGTPISWSDSYKGGTGDHHIYAHWIQVGQVAQHETDTKQLTGSTYKEYDLAGVQIRPEVKDKEDHLDSEGNVIPGSQQNVYSGLRFVAVLSERVYNRLNAISTTDVEYGFVISRTDTAQYYAEARDLEQLHYRGRNVNGTDTYDQYNFVQNLRCSGVSDHFNCEDYRLYTGVITYKNQSEQENPVLARAYLRYTDANGLLRTYYNNYTGTNTMNGCSASYTQVYNMLNPGNN